jgi:N-acetylglucosaminyldiphosphoundecaprenol N-acetyl-beta-D-mannosaminyltransferase
MFETCRILDLDVHHVTLDAVCERIEAFIRSGMPHQIATVNMDFVRIGRKDAAFRDAVNQADLAVPDGVPVIWLSRLLGTPLPERVTGVDIVEQGAALAAKQGYRIFLLGAAPGIADAAATELRVRYPGLDVAGTYSPPMGPFTPQEDTRMVAAVRAVSPDILFVAFGAPRQDVWIREHLEELNVPVCVGVGGTFNFLAGTVKRAPQWMRRSGLEWAYRVGQEPRRLWRRYLLEDLPIFLRLATMSMLPIPWVQPRSLNTPVITLPTAEQSPSVAG